MLYNPKKMQDHQQSQTIPVIEMEESSNMSGYKRDWKGNEKRRDGPKPPPKQNLAQNQYTPMFQTIRAELDEHHDRRERIVKISRDITALSKKMYGSPLIPSLPDYVLTIFTVSSPSNGN